MLLRLRSFLPLLAVLALSACGQSADGPLDVVFIDSPAALRANGLRLSAGAQHLRGATGAGLVSLDEKGEPVPALADRWIVTDDGLSYIFRLRDGTWADGTPLTAQTARAELRKALDRLRGTSLGLDLAGVSEVRTMAGRVVEIRLSRPTPSLLQLLAQPELDLARGGDSGPMHARSQADGVLLAMKPPLQRGEPDVKDWRAGVRPVRLIPADARDAVRRFDDGEVDVVLGGRLGALPLADTGPLSRGTVRLDPAIGMFGLQVKRATGFLARADNREVLALALDRQELIGTFNVGGWQATTRLVPPGLPGDPGFVEERWQGISAEDRRAAAARRVAGWSGANGPVRLTIAMGQSPGLDQLWRELARQFAAVGIRLDRVAEGAPADLELVDQVARYAEPTWFLNQLNCGLRRGLCESAADALVVEAGHTADPAARNGLLARAEARLTLANVFIPIAAPLRFSLVRGTVDGYAPNSWAWHPLQAFALIPR